METPKRRRREKKEDKGSILFTPSKQWSSLKQSTDTFTTKKERRLARKIPFNVMLKRDLRILPRTPGEDLPSTLWAEMHSILNKKHIFIDVDEQSGNIALVITDSIKTQFAMGKLINIKSAGVLQNIMSQYGGTTLNINNQKAWKRLFKEHYGRFYGLFGNHVPDTFFNVFDWRSYFLWIRLTFLKLSSSLSTIAFNFSTIISSPYFGMPGRGEHVLRQLSLFSEQEIQASETAEIIQKFGEYGDDIEVPPRINPNYTYKILRVKYQPNLYSLYRREDLVAKGRDQLMFRLNMEHYFKKSSNRLNINLSPQYTYKVSNVRWLQKENPFKMIVSNALFVNTQPQTSPFAETINNIFNAPTIKEAINLETNLFDTSFDYSKMAEKYSESIKISFTLSGKDFRLNSLNTLISKNIDLPFFNAKRYLANLGSSLAVGSFNVVIEPIGDPDKTGITDGWPAVIFSIEDFVIKWNVEKICLILLFIDLLKDRSKLTIKDLIYEKFEISNSELTSMGGSFLTKWREALVPMNFRHKSEQTFINRSKYINEMKSTTSQLPLSRFKWAHMNFTKSIKKTESRIQKIHRSMLAPVLMGGGGGGLLEKFNKAENATNIFYDEETSQVSEDNDDLTSSSQHTTEIVSSPIISSTLIKNNVKECYHCNSKDVVHFTKENDGETIKFYCSPQCYKNTFY